MIHVYIENMCVYMSEENNKVVYTYTTFLAFNIRDILIHPPVVMYYSIHIAHL